MTKRPHRGSETKSTALGVAAVQAGRATVHDHDGLGVALAAHGGRWWE